MIKNDFISVGIWLDTEHDITIDVNVDGDCETAELEFSFDEFENFLGELQEFIDDSKKNIINRKHEICNKLKFALPEKVKENEERGIYVSNPLYRNRDGTLYAFVHEEDII